MNNKVQNFIEFQRRINESRKPIIKKYVIKNAPTRNTVLKYLYDNGPVKREDFYHFLFGIKESNSKPIATKSWLSKNKIFFKKYQNANGIYFDLNRFGRKIIKKIMNISEGLSDNNDSDHLEILLEPDEEVELRMGDLEIEISQAPNAEKPEDSETLRSKNSINIDDLRDPEKDDDMNKLDFTSTMPLEKNDKNIVHFDEYDDKSKSK